MKIANYKSIILKTLVSLTLFLMIMFPAQISKIKIMLICLTILILILTRRKIIFSKSVIVWMLIYILSGIFFTLLSFFNGFDAYTRININVLEPIFYLMLILLIDSDTVDFGFRIIEKIALVVTIYNLVFFASINNIIPFEISQYMPGISLDYGGLYLGYNKITAQNISWLIFLVPYYISELFICNNTKKKREYVVLTILGIINSLISLRTAYLLSIVLAFIFAYILDCVANKKIKIISFIKIIFIFVFAIFIIYLIKPSIFSVAEKVISDVVAAFQDTSTVNEFGVVDKGGTIRQTQLEILVENWKKRPVFGWGDPSDAENYARSDVVGSYELTYMAMLMQRGVFGLSIYILLIIWLYKRMFIIVKSNSKYKEKTFCLLVAFTIILIANGTNPYLSNFDRLIIQFAPLFIINQFDCGGRK